MPRWWILSLAALAAVAAGCGENSAAPPPSTGAATASTTLATPRPGGAGTATASAATTKATGTAAPAQRTTPTTTDPTSSAAGGPSPVANVYAAAGPNMLSPAVAGAKRYVYVPSAERGGKGVVEVIDQDTLQVVDRFSAGALSQHVVPSWDLTTLYVTASGANSLIPIDPTTGKPGAPIPVSRPYNLYFTPDGSRAIVQAEQLDRIDAYDPHTWKLLQSVPSGCNGNNHADWSADGSYFLVTCEFSGELLKVDTASLTVLGKLSLGPGAMPQDVRLVPDGSKFYVADMSTDGVWIVDGASFQVTGRIATGRGAHGIYPSRDGRFMYVVNRGRHKDEEGRRSRPGDGSVSVVDPTTDQVVQTWEIPGGGSPDMGGLNADGTRLWLSGRYDAEVYVFDTTTGELVGRIPTGPQPHGLLVWPQPGRFSLGHTGNMR